MVRRTGFVLAMAVVALVLGGGVALAAVRVGTESQDELSGTGDSDVLYGGGGGDFLEGCGGDDILYGGDGADLVSDGLCRGSGDDVLYGGDGSDQIFEGKGNNVFYGGDGNDFFQATAIDPDEPGSEKTTPRKRDLVFCGSGKDTVVVDPGRIDKVAPDCERVLVRTGEGDTGV